MDEFPDSDEEAELYENTVHEATSKKPVSNNDHVVAKDVTKERPPEDAPNISDGPSSSTEIFIEQNENAAPISTEPTRKRTFEELLQDIGDIFPNDCDLEYIDVTREKRPRWDDPQAVIELILKEREKHRSHKDGIETSGQSLESKYRKDSISTTIPPWNFIVLTKPTDFERLYIRIREKNRINLPAVNGHPTSGLLGVPFAQMKEAAEEIIVKNIERANQQPPPVRQKTDDRLWVDKYRPRSYMELLTDESVNRACLRWIKLWDKVVFNREIIKRKKPKNAPMFMSKKFSREKEDEGVDAKGFPVQRVVLLSGPPGLGKTTLAHLVARHAGYNVVEVNSSDDRGPEAFRQALLSATEMRSVMGVDPKPNCLILDEIDGASAASVELLIKYVQGKLAPKGKRNKEAAKKSDGCKRPVICICNEAYVPSLRPLRAMAFIIPVPKISAPRLADRLAEIARMEDLNTDQGALLQMAERSGCDVRSCLCTLQYMGEAYARDSSAVGVKDTKRGLFDCWKDVLQVPMRRGGLLPMRERVGVALKAAMSGEFDRLAQGVFHNYPSTCPPKMDVISKTLEWFQFYDKILTVVMGEQDWRVMPYANYAVVAWHFGFASNQHIKLNYPYAPAEANQLLNRNIAMLNATRRTYGRDISTLALDIVPFLPGLLTPRLRSVSGHLYSPKERADLNRLVNVMIEFGLSFVLTKSEERNYEYSLDPNLFEISNFPDCKMRRLMPYAVKQIVVQELETERVRRSAWAITASQKNPAGQGFHKVVREPEKDGKDSKSDGTSVPNHLRQLDPKPLQPKNTKYRNFFEKFVPIKKPEKEESTETSPTGAKSVQRFRQVLTKHGVWYKYKEGFSNSVRRDVKMSDLC